jgi:hypothetical protein
MFVLQPSLIRPFFTFRPRHHVFPNALSSKCETTLLPNDGVLPTADVFTECFEENFLLNGALLPNSAHRSVSSLYQFLVLTPLQEHSRSCGASGARPAGPLTRPHGTTLATRREERPISKHQHLRDPNGYTHKCSGATVGDSHKGPLNNQGKPA